VAKTFPAEKGFESNALSVQVHGGYGYSSEYLPEAWLRDQKLNTIHEGTTGIQGMDLLGRKVIAGGGETLRALGEELAAGLARARAAGVPEAWCVDLERAMGQVAALTAELGGRGLSGDVEGMMRHSTDYLELFSVLVIAWQWLLQAAAAQRGPRPRRRAARLLRGKAVRGPVLARDRAAARPAARGAVPLGRRLVFEDAARVVLTARRPGAATTGRRDH
jgi:hypothetical protein